MTLDLRTEVNLLGSWTQVPATGPGSVRNTAPITIIRGRPSANSSFVPATASFIVDNRDSRWTIRNPNGTWYGKLVQDTPIRFSLPASLAGLSNYLRLEGDLTSSVTTPDKAALQITGPIDIRVDCQPSDYSANVLAAKWGATAQSWALVLGAVGARGPGNVFLDFAATGTLGFYWFDGTNIQNLQANVPLPYYGQRIALRVVFTPATGTAQFYTAATMAGPFTQLGTSQVFGATTLSAGVGQAVQVGGGPIALPVTGVGGGLTCTFNSALGMVYEAQILSGVTVEADPVFSSQTAGATSFADAQANTWTLNGTSEISNRLYRFHGELAALPKQADSSSRNAYASAQAGGVTRRLQQAQAPLGSPMYRGYVRLPSSLNLAAYWSAETGTTATSIGSALGGPAMRIAGAPSMGSNSDFACSAPLPVMNGAVFTGTVTTPAGVTWTDNGVRFLWEIPLGGETTNSVVCAFTTTGAIGYVTLVYTTGGNLTMNAYTAPGGSLIHALGPIGFSLNGQKFRVSIELKKNGGGGTDMTIATLGPGSNSIGLASATSVSASPPGTVTSVAFGSAGITGSVMGHFSVQGTVDSIIDIAGPLNSWNGEPAATRTARLCSEENIGCRIIGPQALSAAMGNQTIQTFMSLLTECEATDQGMLSEPRQALGISYITERALCNQAAVSVPWSSVDPAFSPVSDDTLVLNDVTLAAADAATSRQVIASGAMSVQPPGTGWQPAASSQTSPGAGTVIAATTAVQPATYTINWVVTLSGTLAAGDANNFGLYLGATLIATSVNTATAATFAQKAVTVTVATAAALAVKAIGAGTAGAVYSAIIAGVPPGIGRFDTQATVNPQLDTVLDDLTSWHLHVSSADEDRYPSIPFQLARSGQSQALATLDIGGFLAVTGTPSWVPPSVRQLVAGYNENIGPQPLWGLAFNGIPEAPYETALADSARAQTPGSVVHAAAVSGAGTFLADSFTDLWTTAAGDYPFGLLVAGQRITVSACSGASNPQTFTVSAWGVNGVTRNLNPGDQILVYQRPWAGLS